MLVRRIRFNSPYYNFFIMSSYFDSVRETPIFEIFKLHNACLANTSPRKVNMLMGSYRNEEGKPWVLPVVKKVEKLLAEDPNLNHEYLSLYGIEEFNVAVTNFLLGELSKSVVNGQAFSIQTIGDTGALKLGALFLKEQLNLNVVYISEPSWDNHGNIFEFTHFEHVRSYRYWDAENKKVDFKGMFEDLMNAPENAIILLHVCAHNPTGSDLSKEQWMKISKIMKEKKLFPFFDSAYQGFATGNPEEDAWPVRYFANEGHEFFCAQSFSKNFGLYGERVGGMTVVVNNKEKVEAVKSNFHVLIRATYLGPPSFGARIVATTLTTPEYLEEWRACIQTISGRILEMKKGLRERLEARTQAGIWNHFTDQIGMFCFSGLSVEVIEVLREKYHIYMMSNGRMNMSALTTKNLDYVADSIAKALKEVKIRK